MNPYELILLFDPNLGEEKIGQFVAKIEDKIKGWGGGELKTEKWGTRKLNSIMKKAKKLTQAYYVLISFQSPPTLPAELQAYLKVSEIVVRYFLSRAVEVQMPPERKGIAGIPIEAVSVPEIKGEPFGQP